MKRLVLKRRLSRLLWKYQLRKVWSVVMDYLSKEINEMTLYGRILDELNGDTKLADTTMWEITDFINAA